MKVMPRATDRYGRIVGDVVLPDGRVLNEELAWIPMQYLEANKLAQKHKDTSVRGMLVFDFTPRSAWASEWGYPKTRRNRLVPSQGMTVSVSSRPAATRKGLWARFLIADDNLRLAKCHPGTRIDEILEQMTRLRHLVAVADAPAKMTIQAAGHQRQLKVAVDLQRHGTRQRVHVEEVHPVFDVVLDDHPPGISLDQFGAVGVNWLVKRIVGSS